MSEVEHEHGIHTNEYKHVDEHRWGGTQTSMGMRFEWVGNDRGGNVATNIRTYTQTSNNTILYMD